MARKRTSGSPSHRRRTHRAPAHIRSAPTGWKQNLLLLAITLLVCAVLLELAVRVLWQNEPQYGYPEGLHQADSRLGYTYVPGFTGRFLGGSYDDIEIRTNSQGLRDDEHSLAKPEGTIRILGIGDSVTFGAGVGYEETYLRRLEKSLQADGYTVEVIKAGHGGYNYNQEYLFYELYGKQYDPDIVIFGIVLDDVVARDPGSVSLYEVKLSQKGKVMNFLSRHWKSGKFLYWFYKSVFQLHSRSYNDVYFDQVMAMWHSEQFVNYSNATLALAEELDDEDRELVLVILPYTEQFAASFNQSKEPQTLIKGMVEGADVTVLDMTPFFDVPNYEDYYLYADHAHLNAAGNGIIAEELHQAVIGLPIMRRAQKQTTVDE